MIAGLKKVISYFLFSLTIILFFGGSNTSYANSPTFDVRQYLPAEAEVLEVKEVKLTGNELKEQAVFFRVNEDVTEPNIWDTYLLIFQYNVNSETWDVIYDEVILKSIIRSDDYVEDVIAVQLLRDSKEQLLVTTRHGMGSLVLEVYIYGNIYGQGLGRIYEGAFNRGHIYVKNGVLYALEKDGETDTEMIFGLAKIFWNENKFEPVFIKDIKVREGENDFDINIDSLLAPIIKVHINGKEQHFPTLPISRNGRTLVPLRQIFESLGANIQWNSQTQTVTAIKGNNKIVLKVGSTTANVNGKSIKLDQKSEIIDGSTMVPIRFISESLGATVKWDGNTKTVYITSSTNSSNTKKTLPYIDNEFVRLVKQGKIKGVPFGTKSKVSDVLKKEGKPQRQGDTEGSTFMSYKDYSYLVASGETIVTGILKQLDKTTKNEITKVLGKPSYEGYSEIDGSYGLSYDFDGIALSFDGENENTITSLQLINWKALGY